MAIYDQQEYVSWCLKLYMMLFDYLNLPKSRVQQIYQNLTCLRLGYFNVVSDQKRSFGM